MTPQAARGEAERLTRPAILSADTPRASDIAMRALDILAAGLTLLALSPILLVIAILVRLDSRGPAIFRTMRQGVAADPHRAYVEEMIREESEAEGRQKPMMKLQEDPRITKIGHFLRRTSLDELPQLWNVLRGEMSLVGPRPPIQYEVDGYPARAFRRFAVRPGLTGLWQVSGRSLVTFSEMIDLDIEYVERRSLLLNLKIVFLTVPTVLHGKGAE
jgi:lipopolysaccharide/colanic/teichoic acid biosynthesis glycosyltransferase